MRLTFYLVQFSGSRSLTDSFCSGPRESLTLYAVPLDGAGLLKLDSCAWRDACGVLKALGRRRQKRSARKQHRREQKQDTGANKEQRPLARTKNGVYMRVASSSPFSMASLPCYLFARKHAFSFPSRFACRWLWALGRRRQKRSARKQHRREQKKG